MFCEDQGKSTNFRFTLVVYKIQVQCVLPTTSPSCAQHKEHRHASPQTTFAFLMTTQRATYMHPRTNHCEHMPCSSASQDMHTCITLHRYDGEHTPGVQKTHICIASRKPLLTHVWFTSPTRPTYMHGLAQALVSIHLIHAKTYAHQSIASHTRVTIRLIHAHAHTRIHKRITHTND